MKKLPKSLVSILLALTMLMSMAACGTKTTGSSDVESASSAESAVKSAADVKTQNGEKVKIGFTISDLSNPIWVQMYQKMQEKAKELGAELIVNDAKNDPNSQIDAIENFITMGCQSIIVHAFDQEASLPVVKEALSKGIKVISYDVNLEGTDIYCGLDNYQVGKIIGSAAGKWINDNLNGIAEVGICGYPTISVIVERQKGIEDGLKETAPKAKIVSTVTAGYTPEGVTEGENFLQAYPNINVVCGINDAGILGVYEAFKAANHTDKTVALFGCDATDDALDAINENGIYRGTISLDTVGAGAKMIDAAYNAALGKEFPKEIIMEGTVVTKDNVADFIKK